MSLSDEQWEFTRALGRLIEWARHQPGYKVTMSCARCALEGHHTEGSYHYRGLAIDLNLFLHGEYQETTEAHAKMGAEWKRLGGTWGGDFRRPDGNHYSWGEGR